MSDRELLEKAAKAAGLTLIWPRDPSTYEIVDGVSPRRPDTWDNWNPLTDDGDALRLACALGLVVDCSRPSAGLPFYSHEFRETGAASVAEGTRRAIVRAAAAIGEKL